MLELMKRVLSRSEMDEREEITSTCREGKGREYNALMTMYDNNDVLHPSYISICLDDMDIDNDVRRSLKWWLTFRPLELNTTTGMHELLRVITLGMELRSHQKADALHLYKCLTENGTARLPLTNEDNHKPFYMTKLHALRQHDKNPVNNISINYYMDRITRGIDYFGEVIENSEKSRLYGLIEDIICDLRRLREPTDLDQGLLLLELVTIVDITISGVSMMTTGGFDSEILFDKLVNTIEKGHLDDILNLNRENGYVLVE